MLSLRNTLLEQIKRAHALDELRMNADTWVYQMEPDETAPRSSWSLFHGHREMQPTEHFAPLFRWRKGDRTFSGKPRVHLKPRRYGGLVSYVETVEEDGIAMLKDLDSMIRQSLLSASPGMKKP